MPPEWQKSSVDKPAPDALPASRYEGNHEIWLRLGQNGWQHEVAVDGMWLKHSGVSLYSRPGDTYGTLVVRLPLVRFRVEGPSGEP
jgi:hypothetical protein